MINVIARINSVPRTPVATGRGCAGAVFAVVQARQIGPDPANPAKLVVTWAANLAGPELATLNRLASLYPKAFSAAAAAEFAIRAPLAAAEWQRQHQRSVEQSRDRGPSLGR
jgi:hypothetical protein